MSESAHDHSLLAVFAHPDDEACGPAGTLARYAAEGVAVKIVCLTRGGAGGSPEARAAEVARSARVLGAGLELWDYPDGDLPRSDLWEIVARLVEVIRRDRPGVVITFGPDQLSQHPDHVIVGWLTTLAFHLAGDCELWPGSLPQYAPDWLYFSVSPEAAERLSPCCRAVVDVAPYLRERLAALESHVSQRSCTESFLEGRRSHGLGQEFFQLAACRSAPPPGPVADLFGPSGLVATASTPRTTTDPGGQPVWLFDLDNTLYPATKGLMDAISVRIDRYIMSSLGLPPTLASAVREAYWDRYGSSLSGILRHCRVDTREFVETVHDVDLESYLSPDPRLRGILEGLPGRKYVFTNAPLPYASRALRALGVEGQFLGVFDIEFGGLQGKPSPGFYEKVLAALGHPTGECWFVEDRVQNLVPAKALGCRTVWLTPDGERGPAYVDHVIQSLEELPALAREVP